MTLSDWQQRFLDANGRLPEELVNPPGSGATARGGQGARGPAVGTHQGQASLTSERQRYLVMPGVKGHKAYMVWDNWNSMPKLTTDNRLEAIAFAAKLNTSPR